VAKARGRLYADSVSLVSAVRRILAAGPDWRSRVRSTARRMYVSRSSPLTVWKRGLAHELDWWEDWIQRDGRRWPDAYRDRLDPAAPLDEPLLVRTLEALPDDPVTILDVGAGPCTSLGKTYPGRTLEITPVDALADEYDALWARKGIAPPVRTLRCRGEDLLDRFAPATFDIAYARNALDHTFDPVLVIRNMVAVTKPSGSVLLRHSTNEAEKADYRGLHQWSFLRLGENFVIRRFGVERNVTQLLADEAETRCELEFNDDTEWVTCVITRRG
jgi:SAM-dependent methyltransferase